MNLIRNTLLVVLTLQFIGFLYIKFFHVKERQKIESLKLDKRTPKKIATQIEKRMLPISTEYTDNKKIVTPMIAKVLTKPPLSKERYSIAKIEKSRVNIRTKISNSQKIKIAKVRKKSLPKPIVKVYKKQRTKIKLSTKIEKYAKKMLGKKYVWGATGPKCYDCSGFTQKVYRKIAGVKLPRVSYLQAKVGKRISFKKLKSGDMVFFDTEKKRTGRVNHVGIYLKNGNFIHASSGGKKVMITNFRKKRFYRNRFLWGQRVIHDKRTIARKISLKKLSSKG